MLLDIALGVLGAAVFANLRDLPLNAAVLVAHVVFALLPDADFLLQSWRRRSLAGVESSHRYTLHNPLLYVPAGFAVVALSSVPLACSFIVLSLLHFLHDSVGIGWGVRWLYPFSKRSYKFFSDHDGSLSWNVGTSWSVEEEQGLEEKTNPDKDWFRRIYLHPHPISLAEHAITLVLAAAIAWLLL